jgi:hypothetical protein
MKCPCCSGEVSAQTLAANQKRSDRQRRIVWLTIASVALLIVAVLAFRYRGHLLSGFHLTADALGSNTAAVLVLCLGVAVGICVLLWLALPVIVCFGFGALWSRTAQLERTLRAFDLHQLKCSNGEPLGVASAVEPKLTASESPVPANPAEKLSTLG